MIVEKDKIKELCRDDSLNIITYGYDDLLEKQWCIVKNEFVDIVVMYREYSQKNISSIFLFSCNKSEKKTSLSPYGKEMNLCGIKSFKNACKDRCICDGCFAACGNTQNWTSSGDVSSETDFAKFNESQAEIAKTHEMKKILHMLSKNSYRTLEEPVAKQLFEYIESYQDDSRIHEMLGIQHDVRCENEYNFIKQKVLAKSELSQDEIQYLYSIVQQLRYFFNKIVCDSRYPYSFRMDAHEYGAYYRIFMAKFHSRKTKNPKNLHKACYIATCVYQNYDCNEVRILRRYRDYKLSNSVFGRLLIKIYYKCSPSLVARFSNNRFLKKIAKVFLDKKVKKLQKIGYSCEKYGDEIETNVTFKK